MKKRKTIAGLVDAAAVILQRIVRIKAADEAGYARCVTCNTVHHWKDMDGGHFIPRTYTAHKLREENIHPQCKGCNGFRGEASKVPYTLYMQDTYGHDFVRELENTKRETKKYTRPEIEGIIAELNEYERQLRDEKGIV